MRRTATGCTVLLALAFALLSPAWGRDGGDERFVPIIEWQCYTCGK